MLLKLVILCKNTERGRAKIFTIRILYRVQTGKFKAIYAINAVIEINISHKVSISYCLIKMQIVIILSKILNTTLS